MMRPLPSQENQETLLAVQRSQALDKAAVSIQRVLRGYRYRCPPCPLPAHTPTRHVPWAGLYPPRATSSHWSPSRGNRGRSAVRTS